MLFKKRSTHLQKTTTIKSIAKKSKMIAQKKKKTFKKLFAKNALMVKILSKCTKAAAASKAVIRNVSEQHFSCGSRHDQQLLELKAHRYQNTALKHEFTSGGVKHTQA